MMKRHQLFTLVFLLALFTWSCRPPAPPPQDLPDNLPAPMSLSVGGAIAIHPDGSQLLVVRQLEDINEVYLVATDGSGEKKLIEFLTTSFYADFSPDGNNLVWATDELVLAAADGSNPQVILDDQLPIGPLAWAPNSAEMAIAIGDDVVRISRTGARLEVLAQAESIRNVVWASLPNGQERIVYSSFPAEAPPFIASVNPEEGLPEQIAEGEIFVVSDDLLYFADPFGQGSLQVVNVVDGYDQEVLIENSVMGLAPRPAHQDQIVYVRQGEEIENDLWLFDRAAGSQTQLTTGAPVLGPIWSPDGSSLYYSSFDIDAPEDEDPFQVQKITVP